MIRVLNVHQDKVVGGGIRQFLSRKGDQNSLVLMIYIKFSGFKVSKNFFLANSKTRGLGDGTQLNKDLFTILNKLS